MARPPLMEQELLQYFDHQYLDAQWDFSAGGKLLAALGHQHARYSRLARTRLMPGGLRALQGWEKLHPSATRPPLPMPAVYGLAMELFFRGHLSLARLTVLAADAYYALAKQSG